MRSAYSDPEYEPDLHDKAKEAVPKEFPWPDQAEENIALWFGMAGVACSGLYSMFSGFENIGIPGIAVGAVAAAGGYIWRKADLRAWNKKVDQKYWSIKPAKPLSGNSKTPNDFNSKSEFD
ncbi:MAG: hypothetical protein NXI01_10530 [Gammaproteobacteria bacterium]|nr:hypothetical protein [Gammaproteobacteria bacterium]